MFPLISLVLSSRRLVFSLQLSFFLIYTQSFSCFLVFPAYVFMIYGECVDGCLHAVDFLFFLCLPTDLYIHEGFFSFHSIWLAQGVGTENILEGLTLDFFYA